MLLNLFKKKKNIPLEKSDLTPRGIVRTVVPDSYVDKGGNPWIKPVESWYKNKNNEQTT